MTVSWPADVHSDSSNMSLELPAEYAAEPSSYLLFGVRIDSVAPPVAARAIFEAADEQRRLHVVLADLWTLLLAQRDISVWEALSGADFVMPSADDSVVRRLTRRRGVPAIWPDQLVHDLLLAMEHSGKTLAVMAPANEIASDVTLIQRLWPRLRVVAVSMERLSDSNVEQERLARAVNEASASVLLVGANTPWQERWSFNQRETLQMGAVVLLPTIQPTLAAIAQRAGMKMPGPAAAWLRRRAALQRAFEATLAPAAAASARTLNELLRVPREALQHSPLAKWHLNPATLQRLSLLREARKEPAPVRVAEWHDTDDSAIRRLIESPLTRLGPPRGATPLPALPAPQFVDDALDVAEQPTIRFTREEALAHLPGEVTGEVVIGEVVSGELVGSTKITREVPALGATNPALPAADAVETPTPDAYATNPLADTKATEAPPERVAVDAPLAPTTLLPGRPRHQPRSFAPSAAPAQAAEAPAPGAAQPAAAGSSGQWSQVSPSSSIASPAARLEELATLKAHLHARRRLLRRRRRNRNHQQQRTSA